MKLNELDLNKLVVFSSVVRHAGYRGASEELNLTRSAISQSITGLEESLGQKLFHRVGAGLQLTERAQQLSRDLSFHHQNLETVLSSFTKKSGKVEGQLRIGAYLEFTKSKLMPVVEEFMTSYPDVQMKFIFDSPSRVKRLLETDRIDLSISFTPHERSKSIESKKLYQEELVLIARADLLPQRPRKDTLKTVPVIDYYSSHLVLRRWWYQQFAQYPKTLNVVCFAATAEMVFEMVRRRLGVGVIPKYLLESLPKDERIHIVQPTEKRLYDYIWLSQFKRRDRGRAHSEFLNLLYRRFAAGVP